MTSGLSPYSSLQGGALVVPRHWSGADAALRVKASGLFRRWRSDTSVAVLVCANV